MTLQISKSVWKNLLLLVALAAASTVSAQPSDLRITFGSRTQTRQQAVNEIEAQTDYKVLYNTRAFDGSTPVNFGRTELTLLALLDKLTEGSGNTYTIDNNYILLYRDGDDRNASRVGYALNRIVTGKITDTTGGQPQQGVKVELMNGDGSVAESGADGHFQLNGIPVGVQMLRLTSGDGAIIRYRQISVPAGSNLFVPLVLADEQLDCILSDEVQQAYANPDSTKFTAFFRPNTNGQIIAAFNEERPSEFTFIPTGDLQSNYQPKAAIKTNLLFLALATPNLAAEFALGRKWTLDLVAAYNPFRLQKGGINRFGLVQPEVRYWFCQRFEKHFVGLHGLYGRFNIGEVDFLTRTFEEQRYKGWGAGAGLSYGYHLPMGKRWAWEFTAGVGYVYLEYDRYKCYECDQWVDRKYRHYFGPTKAGISLLFMIK